MASLKIHFIIIQYKNIIYLNYFYKIYCLLNIYLKKLTGDDVNTNLTK